MKLNRENRIKYMNCKIDLTAIIMVDTIEAMLEEDPELRKRVERKVEDRLKSDEEYNENLKFIEDFQEAEEKIHNNQV